MEERNDWVETVDQSDENDETAATPESADSRVDHIVESVLFAAAAPVSLRKLVEILDGPSAKEIQAALARLRQQYGPGRRGIQLHEVAGGYQLRTARENAEWVRAVFRDKPARLGRAALETLAIIAYKQPATRAEIEAIRGVDVDGVVTTLLSRRLIKIAGRKEAVGRPLLYSTTPEFLEAFGLKDLTELPSLKELGPPPDAEEITTTAAPIADTADAGPADGADASLEAGGTDVGAEPAALGETADSNDAAAPAQIAEPVTESAAPDAAAGPPAAKPPGPQAPRPSSPDQVAEDPQPGGDHVAAQGGRADRDGARAGKRPAGDAAGDEGEPTDRPDHD
jgi:segregation and condensation protein B